MVVDCLEAMVVDLEAMVVDGLEAVDVVGWKGTASGFIPVDRLVMVFSACPDSWLGFDFGSFDDDCCPPQMLP